MSILKRSILEAGLAATMIMVLMVPAASQPAGMQDRYDHLHTADYLGGVEVVARIADEEVFSEGPAVDPAGNVYFTNIPVSKVLKWDPVRNELSVFRSGSNGANGLRFDMNGDLLVCEGEPGRLTRIHMKTGEVDVIASEYRGRGLQSLNDLDFDSGGRIYFTSRASDPDPERVNLRSVYRADPDGTVHQLLTEPQVHMPNGIVISPDEKTLYLIEAHSGQHRNRNILAFDLQEDGTLSNRRVLYDFYPGRSGDGMCIDKEGNLYVAAGLHQRRGTSETLDTRPGIHVISPEGRLLAFRETPEDTITNCTFGGEELNSLFITCGPYLLKIRTMIPGKQTYRPGKKDTVQ
jgi:gluconolactonase